MLWEQGVDLYGMLNVVGCVVGARGRSLWRVVGCVVGGGVRSLRHGVCCKVCWGEEG